MDTAILEYVLKNYPVYKSKQEVLEKRFANGGLTSWEFIYASIELLVEHMPPKTNKVTSNTGQFK